MEEKIPIVIADAHYLVRFGMEQLIGQTPGYQVVKSVAKEDKLIEALNQIGSPCIVILDYDQPHHFSIQTLYRIKSEIPETKIMVISAVNDKSKIDQALELGVSCFLTKSCGADEIFDAIKATVKQEKFFCNQIIDHLLHKSYAKEEPTPLSIPLTPREIEIVQLVAKGLIAKEIAELLHLSTHTIYTHRKNIMKKLGLSTSSELVLYAINQGLILQENL